MTATDKLRKLLEHGVKYWDMKTRGIWFGINADGSDHSYEAYDQTNSLIGIAAFDLTPEQAIEATLGRETCHYEPDYMGFTWWDENDVEHYEENSASDECSSASCDKCGYTMMVGEEGWFDGWDEITEWTEEDGSEHKGYILKPRFKFCPNCGKVVG